jgi:hypothetical protein
VINVGVGRKGSSLEKAATGRKNTAKNIDLKC